MAINPRDDIASLYSHTIILFSNIHSFLSREGLIYNPSNNPQSLGVVENFVKTIVQLENTFFDYAEADATNRNILIVCDRGAMDPSACKSRLHTCVNSLQWSADTTAVYYLNVCILKVCSAEEWSFILTKNGWDMLQLRDARYDHVIHMTSFANGAELLYHTTAVRREELHLARERDAAAAKVQYCCVCVCVCVCMCVCLCFYLSDIFVCVCLYLNASHIYTHT